MRKSFQRVIATLNLFQGKQSLTIFLLAAFFALSACDDSSSASDDNNETSAVESSSSVKDSDSTEESSSSIDKKSSGNETKDKSSSSIKESEPVEVSSSSAKETKNSSDSKSSSSVKSDDSSSSNKDKSSSSVKSSSSEKRSSSSMSKEESSSSVIIPSSSSGDFDWSVPKEAYLNPEIQYDSIIDERDGQVYKTVKIGEQVWMAQNLNYADSIATPSLLGKSRCYDNVTANCEVTGRFYKWSAAMDSIKTGCGHGAICSPTLPVQGICPSGWHLPDSSEWNALFNAVGGKSTAGTKLKSQNGWFGANGNRSDAYGFSALPAGENIYGTFNKVGSKTGFWSSTKWNVNLVYSAMLYWSDSRAYLYEFEGYNGFSVRCVKDSD